MKKCIQISGAMILSVMLVAGGDAVAAPAAQAQGGKEKVAKQQAFFARVGNVVITHDEYDVAFNSAARGKFYHGTPPQQEVAALQREVGDQLVARVLLAHEAKRRGIQPDKAEVEKILQGYEQRYANNERWKTTREQVLPQLTARLEEDSIVAQLEKAVRNISRPSQKQVKAYYAANLEKFTEPEQLRVSVILLKIDPSSPTAAWTAAKEKVNELIKQLEAGSDFAELARKHSDDLTAKQGGDLGYLHKGMLPDGTDTVLTALKVGETSKAVQMLEGMAVFRVTDRKVAKVNSFERVEARAGDLLQRDLADAAWKNLIVELKKKTPAEVDQSRFMPLAEHSGERKQAPK